MRDAPVTEPIAGQTPSRDPRGIGLETVWKVVVTGAPMVATLLGTIGVVDLAYHLRAGELTLSSGSIVRVDTFSFVDPGAAWLNQQWGAQALLALVARSGGFEALQLMRSLIVGSIAALVFASCRARGAPVRTSAILTLAGVLLTLPTFGVRPQLFGALIFAAALYILIDRERHPGRIWLLPVLSVVWVNTHGSFVFLPVLIGLTFLDSVLRHRKDLGRLSLVGSVAFAATLVNPFGIHVWSYAADLITDPVVRTWIDEWRPIAANTPIGWAFFASAALVAGYLARRREAASWSDLAWLGTFLAIALGAIRAIAWWGIIAPVILAGFMHRAGRADERGSPALNLGVIGALGVAAVLFLPWLRGVSLTWAPETLVDHVRAETERGDRLMVAQPWASWFEYRLPDRPVFVDARIELYPASVWADYGAIRSARADWSDVLDRWLVDAVVVERDWSLNRFLRADPGWHLAFENEEGAVYLRR